MILLLSSRHRQLPQGYVRHVRVAGVQCRANDAPSFMYKIPGGVFVYFHHVFSFILKTYAARSVGFHWSSRCSWQVFKRQESSIPAGVWGHEGRKSNYDLVLVCFT